MTVENTLKKSAEYIRLAHECAIEDGLYDEYDDGGYAQDLAKECEDAAIEVETLRKRVAELDAKVVDLLYQNSLYRSEVLTTYGRAREDERSYIVAWMEVEAGGWCDDAEEVIREVAQKIRSGGATRDND